MKIEDLTLAKLKREADDEYLHILRVRCLNLYNRYFKDSDLTEAEGLERGVLLNKYVILRKELASRGFRCSECGAALDREVLDRIFRKGVWTIDVPALEEIIVVSGYISAGERFIETPKDVGEIDLIIKDSKPKRNNALELKVADQIRREAGKGASFTYTKEIEGSHMPMWDLVLRPRGETKKVEAKGAAVKTKKEKKLRFNKIILELIKRGKTLEDYEYLIHHIEVDEKGREIIHHCLLYDHMANLFTQDHLVVKDGKPYINGKEIRNGVYHIITGLEPTQEVVWSDEEAKDKGIEPKKLRAGMNSKEKGEEWQ